MTRQANSNDFSFFKSLYFHSDINPFLLYEMDASDDFQVIFDDLLEKKYLYLFENQGIAVGMFKLMPLLHRNSHIAYLGGVAIHPDYMGQGFGKKMMEAILELGRQEGVLRIELSTATINETAIRLYEKVGFQQEGILRKYTFLKSENRFLDEVVMSYLY